MSLATRCTSCGTTFKVVQDQLKVSDGWVRCGRCQVVFNAATVLTELDAVSTQQGAERAPAPVQRMVQPPPPPPPPPVPAPRPVLSKQGKPSIAQLAPPEATVMDFELDTTVAVYAPLPEHETARQMGIKGEPGDGRHAGHGLRDRKGGLPPSVERPDFADAQFPSDALLDMDEDNADWRDEPELTRPSITPVESKPLVPAHPHKVLHLVPHVDSPPVGRHVFDDSIPTITQPSRFSEDFVPEQAVKAPSQRKVRHSGGRGRGREREVSTQQTPEFMRQAQRLAFWRHPLTRGVLSVLLLALMGAFALQLAHQFRDLIAAYSPPLRPYLIQWCEAVGCQLKSPLRIEDLQVESAALVRATSDGPDRYRLTVVINNKAPIDLAWPDIDLTLTDERGTVIARRAFSPHDANWLDTADAKDAQAPDAQPARLPLAASAQHASSLVWYLRAPAIQPAGYTAELFYP